MREDNACIDYIFVCQLKKYKETELLSLFRGREELLSSCTQVSTCETFTFSALRSLSKLCPIKIVSLENLESRTA